MIDYKKDYKEIYAPVKKIKNYLKPQQNFICIDGKGNPNTSKSFERDIQTLYKFMYFIRMSYKKDYVVDSYVEFKVFPLEGNWTGELDENNIVIKDSLIYELMIALPEFVNKDVFDYYVNKFNEINSDFDISKIYFYEKTQHLVVSCLHVGPFDTESETFLKINEFMKLNSLIRTNKMWHKEIYLSDFRRVDPAKYKTILCCEVESKEKVQN